MVSGGNPRVKALSIDFSAELDNPLFWANQLIAFAESDECPTPHTTLLGVTTEEANDYYRATLAARLNEGRPALAFRAALDVRRSISIDFTPDPDPEVQLWLLDAERDKSACIGVESGHFELPALRPTELRWLMSSLGDAHPAYGLLLAPMCYFERAEDAPIDLIERCVASIPAANAKHVHTVARSAIERSIVPEGAIWRKDSEQGWQSAYGHSPRNPAARRFFDLDFAFVAEFFKDTADLA